jgi:hypothetical protein
MEKELLFIFLTFQQSFYDLSLPSLLLYMNTQIEMWKRNNI